jgi:hypothetical protein
MFTRRCRDILWLCFSPEILQIMKDDACFTLSQELETPVKKILPEAFLQRLAHLSAILSFRARFSRVNKTEFQADIDVLSVNESLEWKHVMRVEACHGSRGRALQRGLA